MDFESDALPGAEDTPIAAPAPSREPMVESETSLDREISREFMILFAQDQWNTYKKYAETIIMKRFKDKIDPAWVAYLQLLLKDVEMPKNWAMDRPDDVLEPIMECRVLYTDARAQVKTFTIRVLLEAITGDQRQDPAPALKMPPSRIDDLQALKDVGAIRSIVSDAALHNQFMQQYFTRLPAFIKGKESNPKLSGTGSYLWPYPAQAQGAVQLENLWG